MAVDRSDKYRQMVLRGKYQRLYSYLHRLEAQEWRASFGEVEAVVGFQLPPSARLHRPWWRPLRNPRLVARKTLTPTLSHGEREQERPRFRSRGGVLQRSLVGKPEAQQRT